MMFFIVSTWILSIFNFAYLFYQTELLHNMIQGLYKGRPRSLDKR